MRITSLIAVLLAALIALGSTEKANAGLFVSITVAPPALPVYVQPPIPGPGYMWTPGYWAWDDDAADYYWVPGAWVEAPEPGLLWTPGYWGWRDGVYVFNDGYWGPHIGFYGGVCYGFGYTGAGFAGGYWQGRSFFYNRAVVNVGGTVVINNVYSKTVINNTVSKTSFNGPGGMTAAPNAEEMRAANERHVPPTRDQFQHAKLASQNKDSHFSANRGRPSMAAVAKAGDFSHPVGAKGSAGFAKPASLTKDPRRQDASHLDKPKGPAGAKTINASHDPKDHARDATTGPNKNAVAGLGKTGGANPPGPKKPGPPVKTAVKPAPKKPVPPKKQ